LSKKKKTNTKKDESGSIITVRAICDRCNRVETLSVSTRDLLPHRGGLYQISTMHPCQNDEEMIMTVVLDQNYAVRQTITTPFISEKKDDKWSLNVAKDFKYFVKNIKETDKALQAILTDKTVVIIGDDPDIVRRITRTLSLFSPRKFPLVTHWTEEYVKRKKIIGTTPEIAKQYSEAILVDLQKKVVLNGVESPYCKELIDNLINLEPGGFITAAQIKIEMLIEFAKMLILLSKNKDIGARAIDQVKMDVSPNALQIILEVVAGYDPEAGRILREDWL
jgi:hypothetical protein